MSESIQQSSPVQSSSCGPWTDREDRGWGLGLGTQNFLESASSVWALQKSVLFFLPLLPCPNSQQINYVVPSAVFPAISVSATAVLRSADEID